MDWLEWKSFSNEGAGCDQSSTAYSATEPVLLIRKRVLKQITKGDPAEVINPKLQEGIMIWIEPTQ